MHTNDPFGGFQTHFNISISYAPIYVYTHFIRIHYRSIIIPTYHFIYILIHQFHYGHIYTHTNIQLYIFMHTNDPFGGFRTHFNISISHAPIYVYTKSPIFTYPFTYSYLYKLINLLQFNFYRHTIHAST